MVLFKLFKKELIPDSQESTNPYSPIYYTYAMSLIGRHNLQTSKMASKPSKQPRRSHLRL